MRYAVLKVDSATFVIFQLLGTEQSCAVIQQMDALKGAGKDPF
jgi:hypothetical protein